MPDNSPFEHHQLVDLTAFQRDIIRIVEHEGSPKGLRIKTHLEALYQDDDINHGRLYPNLDDLAAMGLLNKSKRDDRTNDYELTADGQQALDEHRAWLAPD